MKTAKPDAFILVQPNAGIPHRVEGKDVFPETPEVMAGHVESLIGAGANIVGGCCGTTPAHIAAIRKIVDSYTKNK
jgi:5-methyltetrahydrofolate--homocysteine methyltransferase